MKAKRILVIINLFSSAANFIGNQFSYLGQAGYRMHLICSDHPELKDFAARHDIGYQAVELNRTVTPGKDIKALLEICRYIRRHHIDTVICHQSKGRLLGTLAARLTGVPNVVIFAHGVIFETSTGLKRKLLIAENKLESRLSDKVICVSKFVREQRLLYKIDPPHKQYIPGSGTCGGIDTVNLFNPSKISNERLNELRLRFRLSKGDFVIGFVGRLVRDKGVIELLSAFDHLHKARPDVNYKLLIAGHPEKRDGLPPEILKILKEGKDIIYTGWLGHAEMPYYYALMDCLVLPSHREGFGMCNIEAQAMGVPVLTTSITGCRDSIRDGITGYYVGLSSESIVEKISMLEDGDHRNRMGKAGREWVSDNFDHIQIWPEIKSLIDKL